MSLLSARPQLFPQQTPGAVTAHEADPGGQFSILLAQACLDLGAAVSRGWLPRAQHLSFIQWTRARGVWSWHWAAPRQGKQDHLRTCRVRAEFSQGRDTRVPSSHVAAESLQQSGLPNAVSLATFFLTL